MNFFGNKKTLRELLGPDLSQELASLPECPYKNSLDSKRYKIKEDLLAWVMGKKAEQSFTLLDVLQEVSELYSDKSN